MIIDTHVHIIIPGFVKGKFLRANAKMAASIYNRVNGTGITPSEYIEKMKGRVDPDCSKLIETMDACGIDKSVIFGVDWAYAPSCSWAPTGGPGWLPSPAPTRQPQQSRR